MRLALTLMMLPFFAGFARGENGSDALMAQGVAEFTRACQAWESSRFAAAADLFRQACSKRPEEASAFYWLGVSHFHRLLQIRSASATAQGRQEAAESLDDAVEALQDAIRRDERHAESHALLGTLYGMKIDGSLVRALRLGPRVQKHRSQALAVGANNPRVQYLLGMCQYHTAKKSSALREALATLQQAEKLFAAEADAPAGPLEPRWGRGSCLTFIGRALETLGQHSQAADYYRRALALQPIDHLAREGLARVTSQP